MHLDVLEHPAITVGGVVYRRTSCGKLRLLLIKKQAGFWTLPKGRVIPGEALVEAVAREVTEETGLSGVVETAVDQLSYTVHKKGAVYNKVVRYYLLRASGGILRPEKKERIVSVRCSPSVRRSGVSIAHMCAQSLNRRSAFSLTSSFSICKAVLAAGEPAASLSSRRRFSCASWISAPHRPWTDCVIRRHRIIALRSPHEQRRSGSG
jgi:8-oxo-dGTP diphosphatase